MFHTAMNSRFDQFRTFRRDPNESAFGNLNRKTHRTHVFNTNKAATRTTKSITDTCGKCERMFGEQHLYVLCPRIECSFCKESGHHMSVCPHITCMKCGTHGHAHSFEGKTICFGKQNQPELPAEVKSMQANTETVPQQIPCSNCNEMGHHINFCPSVQCRSCGNLGHTHQVCEMNASSSNDSSNDTSSIDTGNPIAHTDDSVSTSALTQESPRKVEVTMTMTAEEYAKVQHILSGCKH